MIGFALFVSLFLAFMWTYVWRSLIIPLQLNPSLKQYLLYFFIFAYSMQIARWLLFWIKDELTWLVNPAYFVLGLLSHLVLLAIVKDALFLFWKPSLTVHFQVNISIFIICLLANIIGTHTAFSGPEVRKVLVPNQSAHPNPKKLKLVQISDLHVGPLIKKSYVQKVVNQVNELNPDIVAVTGDLADGFADLLKNDLSPLSDLKSRYGVFYVTGNHEYYWSAQEWIQAASNVGMTPLINSHVILKHEESTLCVAGVPDLSGHRFDKLHQVDFQKTFLNAPVGAYKILLAHQPNTFKGIDIDVDLILSGHTHRGQFFPFNYIIHFFNIYSKDLNRYNHGWIYVNAGTGFWGPPLRLGVPSEITLIEWE